MESIDLDSIDKTKNEIKKNYRQLPKNTDRNHPDQDLKSIYDKIADRNEFSRDRDRILFSKAFRRLEHKAQVYSHKKGDHFRTRLTHTMEVVQISRSIARNLGLNEDLTEAIALGHDIGHTPYGHEGEKVLDMIMEGSDDLGGKLKYKLNYGGFKHNFNSLKVLNINEKKYKEFNGLDLTWQVLEGILKHTKIRKDGKEWPINKFMEQSPNRDKIENLMKYDYSVTLEGQIVAISDEIAQRQHDIDDGLRDIELKLKESFVIDHILDIIKEQRKEIIDDATALILGTNIELLVESDGTKITINDALSELKKDKPENVYKKLKQKNLEILIPKHGMISIPFPPPFHIEHRNLLLDELAEKIEEREKDRVLKDEQLKNNVKKVVKYLEIESDSETEMFEKLDKIEKKKSQVSEDIVREEDYRWNSLVRDIIDYFIKDVTLNSFELLKGIANHNMKKSSGNLYINKNLIEFSKTADKINESIKEWIDNKIVNSYYVNRFDGKASFIVKQLFKAYYTNPRQMPKVYLRILLNIILANSEKYNCKIKIGKTYIHNIKFASSNPKEINELVRLLQLDLDKFEFQNLIMEFDDKEQVNLRLDEKFLKNIGGSDFSKLKKNCKICDKEKYEKKLLSHIFVLINGFDEEKIKEFVDTDIYDEIRIVKILIENNYAFMSVITDHISEMTDNYANSEYRNLYLV